MANINGNAKNNKLNGTIDPDLIRGLGGNDSIKGFAGADTIIGGGGNDVIEGGADGDAMHGGAGIDTLSYAGSDGGVIVTLGANGIIFNADGHHAAGDTGTGFENIIGSNYDDFLYGNQAANVLSGGGGHDEVSGEGGADTLKGGNGNDSLRGGAGKDKLLGGAGDDVLQGDTGADVLNGGAENDFVIYFYSSGGVKVTLGKNGAATTAKGGHAQGDTISNIENLVGSNFNDVLTGNNLANLIAGHNGNDRIKGGGGNDLIEGGAGNDVLTGGAGADTFRFGAGFGQDTITDFDVGTGLGDVIEFDSNVFINFLEVFLSSQQVGNDVLITTDADNTILLKNVQLASLTADDFSFV